VSGTGFYSRPSSSLGYWRGGGGEIPLAGGQGSNMGPKTQGLGFFSQGQGPLGASGWEPTVVYLLIFVLAEMIVFGFIAKALR
jgi:hypothetical protein